MAHKNEEKITWLRKNCLLVKRNLINVIIVLITTGPVVFNGWWDICEKFIDATKIPINAVVTASYSPGSQDMLNNHNSITNPIYVSIILRNDGSDTIKNVQFDFATASIINVDFGRKRPAIKDAYKRFVKLGDLQSHDPVFITMRTNLKEKKVYTPEEITDVIIKDINIKHDGKPGVGKLISYYSDEGKEKFYQYR